LEAVLGAFVMGILFGQMPRLPQAVHDRLITASLAVFTPIFFAVAGLKVDARALLEPRLFVITLIVIAVASGGKFVGTYLGARLIGRRDHWTSLSFGAGLNARGAMEIIIATIGLQLGILSPDMFSIIVVMAMVTSLMAPPALRWVLARVTPGEEELRRLRREEIAAASSIGRIHRVLLPVRRRPAGTPIHHLSARLLERMAVKSSLSLTVLNVYPPGDKSKSEEFLDDTMQVFTAKEVTRKLVESTDPSEQILAEAQKHYDLMILGATEIQSRQTALFHPVVDELVRLAPCATIVVKGDVTGDWSPGRILVPTNGSSGARSAAELAFLLASDDDEVIALNVIQMQDEPYRSAFGQRSRQGMEATAQVMVDEIKELGDAQGVRTRAVIQHGRDSNAAIIAFCHTARVGLMVLGTSVRAGTERLFLGPNVERLIEDAPCPVVVFNA
jgi:nucleotide-binding universal stress UspA family protein